jgi:hypothetical protein
VFAANRYTCAPTIGVDPLYTNPVNAASVSAAAEIVAVLVAVAVRLLVFVTVSDTVYVPAAA